MQGGETPYTVAKTKEVCEELQPPEMKNQPDVRSDSAYHKFVTVSSIFGMPLTVCKVMISLCTLRRRFKAYLSDFKVSKLLYLDKIELQ